MKPLTKYEATNLIIATIATL